MDMRTGEIISLDEVKKRSQGMTAEELKETFIQLPQDEQLIAKLRGMNRKDRREYCKRNKIGMFPVFSG
jgi:hypothetical protein